MKKSLLFVALTGAALVSSCVSDEVVNVQEQQKQVRIGFSSPFLYENAQSRANVYGEITGTYRYEGSVGEYSYPRNEHFTIFAVEHKGNFSFWPDNENPATSDVKLCLFNGQNLKYDSNVDAWAPKKSQEEGGGYYYWPSGKELSFAALSPAELATPKTLNTNVVVSYGNNGFTISNYEIPSDPAEQYDLMYTERSINNTSANNLPSSADRYSGIPLTFKHALASIHFSLLKDNTVTEDVVLLSIEVKNAKFKGTFNENISTNNAGWTVNDDQTNYTAYSGTVSFPIQPQYVSSLEAQDSESEGVEDNSHALLLMPQDFTDDLEILVTYKVGSSEPIEKPIKVNEYPNVEDAYPLTAWDKGYRYTYRLYYSKESEKSDIIYFAPSTDAWTSVDIIEVRL